MVSIVAKNISLAYRLSSRKGKQPQLHTNDVADKRVILDGKNPHVQALFDVSFSLQRGDRLGLVGSNGAGKTTLLKVLYGILPPTSGSLLVDGQVDALFNINLGFRPEATGRRNILLRGLINGWPRDLIEMRMDQIIEFSELGEFIDLPFKTYSQGMAARLAFSVATALEPEILLMDEWLGAGDPGFQEKASQRMKSLTEKAGIIVLASHNQSLIRRTCNKILELQKGYALPVCDIDDWLARQKRNSSTDFAVTASTLT